MSERGETLKTMRELAGELQDFAVIVAKEGATYLAAALLTSVLFAVLLVIGAVTALIRAPLRLLRRNRNP